MRDAPAGVLVRALLADRAVRLLLVEVRGPAEHARRLQGLGPDAARLGAEALIAAALMSAFVKGEEELTLRIRGQDPPVSVLADVTAEGDVRARVDPKDPRLRPDGTLDGLLAAVKHHRGRELYRGITAVDGRTVEQALAKHLGTSDQVAAILRIGVWQGAAGAVEQAGGLLVERLPEEPDLPSLSREQFAARYGWLAQADLRDVFVSLAFGRLRDEPVEVVDRRPLGWRCRCSAGKVEDTLATLDAATLRAMADEDHGAEITCDFCGEVYRVGEDVLRGLAARQAQRPAR